LGLQQFLDNFYYTLVIMGVVWCSSPSIWKPRDSSWDLPCFWDGGSPIPVVDLFPVLQQ